MSVPATGSWASNSCGRNAPLCQRRWPHLHTTAARDRTHTHTHTQQSHRKSLLHANGIIVGSAVGVERHLDIKNVLEPPRTTKVEHRHRSTNSPTRSPRQTGPHVTSGQVAQQRRRQPQSPKAAPRGHGVTCPTDTTTAAQGATLCAAESHVNALRTDHTTPDVYLTVDASCGCLCVFKCTSLSSWSPPRVVMLREKERALAAAIQVLCVLCWSVVYRVVADCVRCRVVFVCAWFCCPVTRSGIQECQKATTTTLGRSALQVPSTRAAIRQRNSAVSLVTSLPPPASVTQGVRFDRSNHPHAYARRQLLCAPSCELRPGSLAAL